MVDNSAAAPGHGQGDLSSASLEDIAEQMSDLARSLQAEKDEESILRHMVKAAIDLVPGAEEASITVVTGREAVQSHAPSDDLPERVDALQAETGQGPCLSAVFEHRTVGVPDMATEDRWPRFAPGAAALGAASMLAFQLFVEGDNLGALNLYSRSAHAFGTDSEEIGLLVAAHAAVAFAESQKMAQMHDALASRDLIGQAKGILMERYKITAAQAFILLGHSSSRSNIKLVKIAEHLTGTGELPRQAG
ncbi:GAF and ANTAR domain-containing protein [Arthrobacter zhaoguopingii]|uniref:GAF and ANTAR domain-containing protein n=1 Tax=Arthrobacter zhaoguopingii TaxID=2681491 RepID=UPI001FE69102|nr:GAF and ANTAR domain-containing protein [Arthrobacter zhaoguopingii]